MYGFGVGKRDGLLVVGADVGTCVGEVVGALVACCGGDCVGGVVASRLLTSCR